MIVTRKTRRLLKTRRKERKELDSWLRQRIVLKTDHFVVFRRPPWYLIGKLSKRGVYSICEYEIPTLRSAKRKLDYYVKN